MKNLSSIRKTARRMISFLFFCLAIFLPQTVLAEAFTIESFNSDIVINPDSSIKVTETIETNFNQNRRGIFRDIPYKYKGQFGDKINLDISAQTVVNESGKRIPFETSKTSGNYRIKIGDPDLYVFGPVTYVVTYSVDGALLHFNDKDELYWNITGNEWPTTIGASSAQIRLAGQSNIDYEFACYTGELGSTSQDCEIIQDNGVVTVSAIGPLTAAVSFPKGLVEEPTAQDKFIAFLLANYGYFVGIAAFLGMFLLWFHKGRDPKGRGIIRQYDAPDDLTPAETGVLISEKMKPEFMSAEIVNLAVKGYIKIRELKEDGFIKDTYDYRIIRKKEWKDSNLKPHEKLFLDKLLKTNHSVKISDLSKTFYKEIQAIRDQIQDQFKQKQYYDEHPNRVKGVYSLIGTILGVLFWFFGSALGGGLHIWFGAIVGIGSVLLFGNLMPKFNLKGIEAYNHAKGFKIYIKNAEVERIKFEEQKNLFFQYMPYAMIYGLAHKWANAFESLVDSPPDWYEGATPTSAFRPAYFASTMDTFASTSNSHLTPTAPSSSGSSGGGFSGGGFGGGGGGSW